MNDRRDLLVAAGLMALGATRVLADDKPDDKPKRPLLERVAPDAPLGRTLDGAEPKLSDHAGKVVVVSFWASWCGPCREEFPYLDRLQQVGGDRLHVASVNTEERRVFVRLHRAMVDAVHVQMTYDPDKKVGAAFSAPNYLPYTVVLRRDRTVAGINTGWGQSSLTGLVDMVNAALAA